ncbi:MAG: PaaI family thioesterase [Thermoanaerobaculia bacterium]
MLSLLNLIPARHRDTAFVRLWAWKYVRLIWFIRPTVVEISDQRCAVRVRLNRRTRNHLGSMYFGALCAGADVAGGLIAMRLIQRGGNRVSLVFADFKAEFHRRPESDVVFTCENGDEIAALVERVMASGERDSTPVTVIATAPDTFADQPVATFVLTLSLKRKST